MKVRALRTNRNLHGFFEQGDILELTPILYEEDTKVANAVYGKHTGGKFGVVICRTIDKDKEGVVKLFDEVIAKKGTYKGYTLTNKKGITYSDSGLLCAFGFKSLDHFFVKV
jgi:hypothetical protein